jgi:crotonobetainyl-CoA:carnitine CoA-transferase CaiB-like acyl-CoA transferase
MADRFWRAFARRSIGHPDLPNDPRFVDWTARIENEVALRAIIEEVFANADAATWDERLTAANVPCSRIWSIAEVVRHPQLASRTVLQKVNSPHCEVELVASGIRYAHGGAEIKRFPVMPGADTDAVLGEAGYTAEEIAGFKAAGIAASGIREGRKS